MIDKIQKAFELLNIFDTHGYEAYIVGGAARDMVRGLSHSEINDIDITTNAIPEQIIEVANLHNIYWFREGANAENYGTVTLIYNDIPMQVTPFRTDSEYNGRHCKCSFGKSLREDLFRRDFAINAIAIDKNGCVTDYFGGINDLKAKIIRAIEKPDVTFKRDELRAVRAVRFATTLGFKIEHETFKALSNVRLNKLSKDRIRDELIKILKSPNRQSGILWLWGTGLLYQIIPEMERLMGTEQDEINHPEKDVFVHTLIAVGSLPASASVELVMATALHDIAKPVTRAVDGDKIHFYEHEYVGASFAFEIMQRLKFSAESIKKVMWLVKNHMRGHKFDEMKKAKKIELITHLYFKDLMSLLVADILGSLGSPDELVSIVSEFISEYEKELKERPVIKEKLINGYDVMNLGVDAGIKVGQILEKVNDEIIEGRINTREEALDYIRKLISENVG